MRMCPANFQTLSLIWSSPSLIIRNIKIAMVAMVAKLKRNRNTGKHVPNEKQISVCWKGQWWVRECEWDTTKMRRLIINKNFLFTAGKTLQVELWRRAPPGSIRLFDIWKFFIYRKKIRKTEGRKLHKHLVGKVLVVHVLGDLAMFLLK